MRRVCAALRWLAVVALAAGLLNALAQVQNASVQANAPSVQFGIGSTTPTLGIVSRMMTLLVSELPSIASSVAFTLGTGVVIVGVVVAWASHLNRWFAALLVVELLALVAPYVANAWFIVSASPTPAFSLYSQYSTIVNLGLNGVQLIPVALTLAVARAARKAVADPAPGAKSSPDDVASDTDAALEIVRTRI